MTKKEEKDESLLKAPLPQRWPAPGLGFVVMRSVRGEGEGGERRQARGASSLLFLDPLGNVL